MATFILSPEAQTSLKNIRAYSIKNFGSKRAKAYLQSIRDHMQALAKNPSLGAIRKDLTADYYSSFVGSHTIYYRQQTSHIDIN